MLKIREAMLAKGLTEEEFSADFEKHRRLIAERHAS